MVVNCVGYRLRVSLGFGVQTTNDTLELCEFLHQVSRQVGLCETRSFIDDSLSNCNPAWLELLDESSGKRAGAF